MISKTLLMGLIFVLDKWPNKIVCVALTGSKSLNLQRLSPEEFNTDSSENTAIATPIGPNQWKFAYGHKDF